MTTSRLPGVAFVPNISLALRFSLVSAAIAGAALIIIGTLFWTYTVRQVTERGTEALRLHAEFDAAHAGAILDAVFSTIKSLASNSVLATALVDSAGKEAYLIPFLQGFFHVSGIPVGIVFTDFEGGVIATNGAPEPSAEEQAWLKATLTSGRRQATILPAGQDGRRVMLAAELLTYSRSQLPEGALLYRIPLEALVKDSERLVWGPENGPTPEDRLVVSEPVVTDPITAPLALRYRISVSKADLVPSQTATIVTLLLATLAVMGCVLLVSQLIAKRLTRSLVSLTEFSGSVVRDGLSDSRAEVGGPPEVASLAATLNVMLDRLADMTSELQRKAWEESARQRSELLLSNASDGVHILEPDGCLVTASKSFYQMLGYDPDAPPVLKVWDWDTQWSKEYLIQYALPQQLKVPQTFQTKHRRRDGSVFDVEIHSQGIELDGRRVLYASSRDISERIAIESELRKQQAYLQNVMQSVPGVFYVFNSSGQFVMWNRNLEAVLGYTAEEIRKAHPLDFFSGPDKGIIEQAIQHVFTAGQVEVEAMFVTKAGKRIPYFFNGIRSDLENDPILIGAGFDISERKAAEQELLAAKTAAEAASRAKTQFLTNMSHEIRTPITGVFGMLDLLRRTSLTDEQNTYIDTLFESTSTLHTILNDILDLSKIKAGRLDIETLELDLHGTIRAALGFAQGMAEAKALKLSMSIAPDVPQRVLGDPTRLKQIIHNLMGNAIKFTDAGSIKVMCSHVRKVDDISNIPIQVRQAIRIT